MQGGGTVEALLMNSQNQPIKLHLSNVAYAPRGRCNLLSLGLLATKAGVEGHWNDRGLTLSTRDQKDIGYATLSAGLFQVHIMPLSGPVMSMFAICRKSRVCCSVQLPPIFVLYM